MFQLLTETCKSPSFTWETKVSEATNEIFYKILINTVKTQADSRKLKTLVVGGLPSQYVLIKGLTVLKNGLI